MEQRSGLDDASMRRHQILLEAEQRYAEDGASGADALFVYLRPSDKQLITMTLEQAMLICGDEMLQVGRDELWAVLDKWRDVAKRLESKNTELFGKSLELGRNALRARGIEVGDTSGEIT